MVEVNSTVTKAAPGVVGLLLLVILAVVARDTFETKEAAAIKEAHTTDELKQIKQRLIRIEAKVDRLLMGRKKEG